MNNFLCITVSEIGSKSKIQYSDRHPGYYDEFGSFDEAVTAAYNYVSKGNFEKVNQREFMSFDSFGNRKLTIIIEYK